MAAIIETSVGPLQGFVDTHQLSDKSTSTLPRSSEKPVQKYLGVPYGRALRWAQATAPPKSTETIQCVEFGPSCPQPSGPLMQLIRSCTPGYMARKHLGSSESDLFTLNLFSSDGVKAGDDVPVMVWIHGGSWKDGASNNFLYDPTGVIRGNEKPLIIVTINYRVNILGFCASKDLVDEDGLVGNYGLRDQLLAFKWVNKNISAFGGDPSNVTIYGESAGGASVGWHIGGIDPLFKHAIAQSGAASTMNCQKVEQHEKAWQALLSHFNIELDDPLRVQKARNLSSEDLLGYIAANPSLQWNACFESGPKAIWDIHPDVRISIGNYPSSLKSVMLGCCADEGAMFTEFMGMSKSQSRTDKFISQFGDAAETIRAVYHGIDDVASHSTGLVGHPVSRFLNDALFEGPVRFLAETLSSTPNVKSGKSPTVYLYKSQALLPVWAEFKFGVHHISELPFMFNTSSFWDNDSSRPEAKVAANFLSKWAQFAANGVPASTWPAFTQSEKNRLIFENDGTETIENLLECSPNDGLQLFSHVIRSRWGIEEAKQEAMSKI